MENIIRRLSAILLAVALAGSCLPVAASSSEVQHRVTKRHQRRKKLIRKGGWAGAGFAAGEVAGPAGSAAVGAAKYRKDLKAGGRKRAGAVAKIGGPIAAGAVAGPAGTVGFEAVEHRNWIRRHLLPHQKAKRPIRRRRT